MSRTNWPSTLTGRCRCHQFPQSVTQPRTRFTFAIPNRAFANYIRATHPRPYLLLPAGRSASGTIFLTRVDLGKDTVKLFAGRCQTPASALDKLRYIQALIVGGNNK